MNSESSSNIYASEHKLWWDNLQAVRQAQQSLFMRSPRFDPLGDGKSSLQLIDVMGLDLSVANDARASFDRVSPELSEADIKLIDYLLTAKPVHSSPLRGCVLKFKVSAPLSTCAQWKKHVVASSHIDGQAQHNECSFRYTEVASDRFYIPEVFRSQSKSNRQASGEDLSPANQLIAEEIFTTAHEQAYAAYKQAIDLGVAREQARDLLPVGTYTSWVWTVSLQALLNFIELRRGEGAQTEIGKYAAILHDITAAMFPNVVNSSFKEGQLLTDGSSNSN